MFVPSYEKVQNLFAQSPAAPASPSAASSAKLQSGSNDRGKKFPPGCLAQWGQLYYQVGRHLPLHNIRDCDQPDQGAIISGRNIVNDSSETRL